MKTAKIIVVSLGIVFVLIALLICADIYARKTHLDATRLPVTMTLTAFLEERPNPIAIYKFTVNEKVFVFVQATYPPGDLGMPSGPPAYIFDDTGKLADWTDDNNEGRSFAPYWGSDHSKGGVPTNATPITIEEAKQLVKPH